MYEVLRAFYYTLSRDVILINSLYSQYKRKAPHKENNYKSIPFLLTQPFNLGLPPQLNNSKGQQFL